MEKLTAQAHNMAGLVAYQPGSVVSRTLINADTGTVTLFAFAQGQGLSEHTAPYDALVYILAGEAEVTISGNPILVKAGEMVIMPAGEPHALKAKSDFKMLLVMIRS
ncbi:MAG: cupin domain-containing protein [bacterium]|jgi:quercetin dioxygenase-like cupin family protein